MLWPVIGYVVLAAGPIVTTSFVPDRDRQVFIQSFEGEGPSISRYSISGHFRNHQRFELDMEIDGSSWNVRLNINEFHTNLEIPFDIARDVVFSNVVVASRSQSPSDEVFLVQIPFGEAHVDCFLNGQDVYDRIFFAVRRGEVIESYRSTFTQCVLTDNPLGITAEGVLVMNVG